jgi:hypothetical protein
MREKMLHCSMTGCPRSRTCTYLPLYRDIFFFPNSIRNATMPISPMISTALTRDGRSHYQSFAQGFQSVNPVAKGVTAAFPPPGLYIKTEHPKALILLSDQLRWFSSR